jgi:hypothetical protein
MLLEDCFSMESFVVDSIDGLAPRMKVGNIGLAEAAAAKLNKSVVFSPQYLELKPSTGLRVT